MNVENYVENPKKGIKYIVSCETFAKPRHEAEKEVDRPLLAPQKFFHVKHSANWGAKPKKRDRSTVSTSQALFHMKQCAFCKHFIKYIFLSIL